jgi:hypothetical protein
MWESPWFKSIKATVSIFRRGDKCFYTVCTLDKNELSPIEVRYEFENLAKAKQFSKDWLKENGYTFEYEVKKK